MFRPFGYEAEYFRLGTDIDATAWLVEQQHLGICGQHLADHHLLLIAARERTDGRSPAIRLDRDALDRIVDQLLFDLG